MASNFLAKKEVLLLSTFKSERCQIIPPVENRGSRTVVESLGGKKISKKVSARPWTKDFCEFISPMNRFVCTICVIL